MGPPTLAEEVGKFPAAAISPDFTRPRAMGGKGRCKRTRAEALRALGPLKGHPGEGTIH